MRGSQKPWAHLCYVPVVTFNPNRTHLLAFRCYDVKQHMIEGGCLIVSTMLCSETTFPNVTTRSFCFLKKRSTVNVLSSQNMKIQFPWFFRSFSKRMLVYMLFWTIAALNSGVLECLKLFLPIFLSILNTVETETFFLCQFCHFFGMGSFRRVFYLDL